MNARAPDGSDEPEAVDQVMLAVLANRGREATVLTAEQERLLDDWLAGGLAPQDAERAATLVRQNTLAAERVLERRLQMAARREPAGAAGPGGAGSQDEPANQGRARRRLVAFVRALALDGPRRRRRAGRDRGGGRRAAVAADDAGQRLDPGRHGDDRRSQRPVRTLRHPHEGTRPAGPRRRAAFPRRRGAGEHPQGPVGGGGVIAQRRVARHRALSVAGRRRPAVARHPRHRAQGQDRCRRRRRAHGCAHLRSRRSPLGRHPAPGRRLADRAGASTC